MKSKKTKPVVALDQNYWWVVLQYALKDGRHDDADEARRELARFGYRLELSETAQGVSR